MTLLQIATLRILIGVVCFAIHVNSEVFDLAISHCNDVSGQIEAFEKDTHNSSKAPIPCTNSDGKNCIGGFTNLVHWLHEYNGDNFDFSVIPNPNILKLSSGNIIGGESGWISAVENGWSDYAERVKTFIDPNFMVLGMKEFGAGLRQTITFAQKLGGNSTVGVANTCDRIDYSDAEEQFCKFIDTKYIKHTLVKPGATVQYDIGIIGFVTPTVERLSLPGELKFSDIAETIKKITEEEGDIRTFIAIGDGNLYISKQIIDNAPKVKLVIYGSAFSNTNTNIYPLEYRNSFIATAGRYGSSVGKLHFQVNTETGDIAVKGRQLVLTETPEFLNDRASQAKTKIAEWENLVNFKKENLIGNSRYNMTGGEKCWREECNIGNLMTDAVVHCVLNRFHITQPFPFILYSIWHGGAFIEDTVSGTISEFDVHKWLPYHNNVHLVKVKGSNLRKVFEASATGIEPEKFGDKDWHQFLQVSEEFEVFYDTMSDSPKVTAIRLVHDTNGYPEFDDLDNDKEYHLAIPTYLYEGRGVYEFAKDFWTPEEIPPAEETGQRNVFDDECLEGYIKAMKHISVGLYRRIWVNAG